MIVRHACEHAHIGTYGDTGAMHRNGQAYRFTTWPRSVTVLLWCQVPRAALYCGLAPPLRLVWGVNKRTRIFPVNNKKREQEKEMCKKEENMAFAWTTQKKR